jgi:hypothetical protein
VVIFVASALPTLSIVALYFIASTVGRLIFIVLFSGLFASALGFFTAAKRVEIFTASAALASVQVVFVVSNRDLEHGKVTEHTTRGCR